MPTKYTPENAKDLLKGVNEASAKKKALKHQRFSPKNGWKRRMKFKKRKSSNTK